MIKPELIDDVQAELKSLNNADTLRLKSSVFKGGCLTVNPVLSDTPSLEIDAKQGLPYYIYKEATLNEIGLKGKAEIERGFYFDLLKMSGIKDSYEVGLIKDCVERKFFANKTCEHGHVVDVFSSCSDEVFCPRCNERNVLERKDAIMSKFEYFKWNSIGKFIFTVPEEYRDVVMQDKKKFFEIVKDTLFYFFGGMVGGLYVPHDYSTEQPWVFNPHVEVYISDKIVLNRKYTSYRKTVCRVNRKTGKTQVFNPDKNISFKEAWDRRHGRSVYSERKPRELSGDFEDIYNMFLSDNELEVLKKVYSFLFEVGFGVSYKKLNVNYSYYQKDNKKSLDKLMFHAIPYSLKMPLNPEAVKDVSADGVVSYVTNRNGEDIVVMDSLENVKKVFDLDYYNKSRSKRLCWFGYMSDGVWRDYAKLLSGVFPELMKKKVVDDFFVCSVCGGKIVFVKTNSMVYKWRCVEHDIKHEFIDEVIN